MGQSPIKYSNVRSQSVLENSSYVESYAESRQNESIDKGNVRIQNNQMVKNLENSRLSNSVLDHSYNQNESQV